MKQYLLKIYMLAMLGLLIGFPPDFAGATAPPDDESALFLNSLSPDALLIVDLSASMDLNIAGGAADSTNPKRLTLAKRAIFSLLDDNNDNLINSADEGSLGVRIGYMRFENCDNASEEASGTTYSYTSGCNLIPPTAKSRLYIGSKYSQIFCGDKTSCSGSSPLVESASCSSVYCARNAGGTALAASLTEAKLYLIAQKAADSSGACRRKYAILITDGSDNLSCGGDGSGCQADAYKRRREMVAKAKALADAGFRLFIIGIGSSMPDYLKNALNWMAYYGQTDNPDAANTGSTSGYDPSSVTSCQTSTLITSDPPVTCIAETGSGVSIAQFFADSTVEGNGDDPGNAALSGYAFLAASATELETALKSVFGIIRQANFSFSQSSVQSTRTEDENYLYEGSFEPSTTDSFWRGHLKKYEINDDGTVGTVLWDAGIVLRDTDASARTIKTYKSNALTVFTTGNISPAVLDVDTDTQRNEVVGYIRGEVAYNPEQDVVGSNTVTWKLGDVFRSTPITVGTPSAFYEDGWDENNQFASHRSTHVRTSAIGNRLIVTGANAGQFHAFKTSNGTEAWSFVPPNLLTKLKNLEHQNHDITYDHLYFVDGPVTVADVWWGTGSGKAKADGSWKTILVFGEGRGATDYAWSSSASCDSGISATYSATYRYYCGYYAFNLNDSLDPVYLWHLNFTNDTSRAAQAPYLGEPWSKMMVGRIRYNYGGVDTEKWVGFIGAGYNGSDCKGGGGCDGRGKGFYVVDLEDGEILWSYTYANNSNMAYSIPGTAAIVDTDNDSFVDLAYIGDLGGNMWRFRFCREADMPNCSYEMQTTTWSGNLFFDSSTGTIRPIYTSPAVAKDSSGTIWVYWGTGDKMDPTAANAQEHFYGVKDLNWDETYELSDIENITADDSTYIFDEDKVGWRIQFAGQGEKMLADPAIFGGVVYFTTYTPNQSNNPCEQAGEAKLFAVEYTTGAGALPGAARSMSLGYGIPSSPVLSLKPGSGTTPDLYVTTSGGGGTTASTQRVNINPPGAANRTNMLYWKDLRVR
ncbi:MAG: hypothetical protein JW902_08970 [Syntrophaceae bacterium]|nr:hypothetical protein [Syntrophaceae bacterium]